MGVRKTKEMEAVLIKKGFRRKQGDHRFLILYEDGKKTSIRTKISHSKKEYDDSLLNIMAKQLKLSKSLFNDLLDCPLSYEEYISILREQESIQ